METDTITVRQDDEVAKSINGKVRIDLKLMDSRYHYLVVHKKERYYYHCPDGHTLEVYGSGSFYLP